RNTTPCWRRSFDCICACVDPIRKTAGIPFMTDRSSAGFSWVCPACDRRVPRKFTECRCGYTPNWSDAPPEVASEAPQPSALSSAAGIVLSVVVALAAIVGGAWYMNRAVSVPPPTAAQAPSIPEAGVTPAPLQASASHPAPADSAAAQTRLVEAPSPERRAAAGAAPLEDLVARAMPAVVRVETSSGTGSGFFVAADT